MKTKLLLLVLTGIIFLSSCATIFQGARKDVFLTSEPPTAKIYVDDEYLGTGHAVATLKRNSQHTIMAKQDDYQTRYMSIDRHVQAGWIVGDIFCGWLGIIIDACTGAWNTFDKDHYIIQLDKK